MHVQITTLCAVRQSFAIVQKRRMVVVALRACMHLSGTGTPDIVVVASPDIHHDRVWSCPKPDCKESPCSGEPAAFVRHLTSHGDFEGFSILLCTITFQTRTGELKHRRKLYTIGRKPAPAVKKKQPSCIANQQQRINDLEEQNATLKQANASSTASNDGLQDLLKGAMSMMAEKDRTHAEENNRMLAIHEKLGNNLTTMTGRSFSSIQEAAGKYNNWAGKKRAR